MYYVYKVSFPTYNAVYIGCTNNLRRRKDQHNANARTGKSFFGRFMKSAGIVLSVDDMKVIGEFAKRPKALGMERDETLALRGTGILMLNDNYSDHCSRRGLCGELNPNSRRYIVIDMENHTIEQIENVHAWCDSHDGTSYKTLIGTATQRPYVHAGRYILRRAEEWGSMSKEERAALVSGAWYADLRAESEKGRRETISKRYRVIEPDGSEVIVKNLDQYAKEHGVNAGNLHASLRSGKAAAGYTVVERLS